jgi:TRAP transporter 4TM/12TM fusion protein
MAQQNLSTAWLSLKSVVNPASLIALAWVAFQIDTVYGTVLDFKVAVPIHVMFAVAIAFVLKPLYPNAEGTRRILFRMLDYAVVIVAAAIAVYYVENYERLITRIGNVAPVTIGDYVVGIMSLIIIIEATRRVIGKALAIVILFFLLYQFSGTLLQGVPVLKAITHSGNFSWQFFTLFIDEQALQSQGMFGIPSIVSYSEVFYFLIFGAFLEAFGVGQLFVDAATLLVGRFRGGMAKVAVIASTMFGAISGSATANAAVMGSFTIPAMKRSGMSAEEASAIEATASSGGQIMPPVMGAAAFLIAQFLGKPYRDVALMAIIPALLFYTALFFVIDATAKKKGYEGLKSSEINVTWRELARNLYLFIPIVVLVYDIFSGRSLSGSTIESIIVLLILVFIQRTIRGVAQHGITQVGVVAITVVCDSVRAFADGGRAAITVAIPCAGAGIVVGVVAMTNLGLTFGGFVGLLSGGLLAPALILIMIMVIIMGMGMPTTAAYIMGAVLGVPALIQFNVQVVSAHFFVLYFAVLSMVTPPVALAAFVAGGIGHADIWKTGLLAFRNSLAGFIVGYAVVASPALLMQGSAWQVLLHTVTALVGCYALANGIVGYLRVKTTWPETIALCSAAVLLVAPFVFASLAGLVVLAATWFWQSLQISKGIRTI